MCLGAVSSPTPSSPLGSVLHTSQTHRPAACVHVPGKAAFGLTSLAWAGLEKCNYIIILYKKGEKKHTNKLYDHVNLTI